MALLLVYLFVNPLTGQQANGYFSTSACSKKLNPFELLKYRTNKLSGHNFCVNLDALIGKTSV